MHAVRRAPGGARSKALRLSGADSGEAPPRPNAQPPREAVRAKLGKPSGGKDLCSTGPSSHVVALISLWVSETLCAHEETAFHQPGIAMLRGQAKNQPPLMKGARTQCFKLDPEALREDQAQWRAGDFYQPSPRRVMGPPCFSLNPPGLGTQQESLQSSPGF